MPAIRTLLPAGSAGGPISSTSSRREEEPVPGLARDAEVAAGVVLEHHRELHDALEVLLDRLDDRGLAVQRALEDVAAAARVQAHEAAAADRGRPGTVDRPRRAALEPVPARPGSSRAPAARARSAPCRRISSSGERPSERSRISRTRGSDARASAFSSSVSWRMLRISSWSISPPSNRSPGLSGAIRGWSSRMIGDDSSVSRVARLADEHGPRARGSRTRPRPRAARPAGRSGETNAPPSGARSVVCASRTSAAAPPRAGRRPTASCSRSAR